MWSASGILGQNSRIPSGTRTFRRRKEDEDRQVLADGAEAMDHSGSDEDDASAAPHRLGTATQPLTM